MSKWKLSDEKNKDTIIETACRYLNASRIPSICELAAIIGIDEIPEREDANETV